MTDTGELTVFDNVDVTLKDCDKCWELGFSNTTDFDADIKIFTEKSTELSKPLGECYLENCLKISVPAKSKKLLEIIKS